MNWSKYLLESLIDAYCLFCSTTKNMDENDIELMFMEGDRRLTDIEFFFDNSDELLDNEILDSLYAFICDMAQGNEIDLEGVVSYLCGRYVIYRYNGGIVTNYIRTTEVEDIARLFSTNVDFGMELLRSHFEAIVNYKDYNRHLETAKENNDEIALKKFAPKVTYDNVRSFNGLLRGVICHIYEYYINNGCEDVEALNMTWMYFFANTDPIGELDKLGLDEKTKTFYKSYALGLIFADLFEDECNESIIKSDNFYDKAAKNIPLLAVRRGTIPIPTDESIRNRLLKHFILLQSEKEKMEANRNKTIQEGRVKELKIFNPLYQLDAIDYKKR